MKVYINREPKLGPWGGGIKTVNKLVDSLKDAGHDVVFRLEKGIDVIFCIDPRPNQAREWYQDFVNYKQSNPKTKIVQRVGDLGTHSKPELTSLVKQTLQFSDYFIFPSEWARDWIGFTGDNHSVVHNAPMPIFHNHKRSEFDSSRTPRIVTHHWSMNPKKGFHIYEELQEHIDAFGDFEFTYIGRMPEGTKIRNHITPIGADELSKELPKHDIYITASIEEAGANHVLEAMAAGLPVVYHLDGGSIDNYCSDYGIGFSSFEQMMSSIRSVLSEYDKYKSRVMEYTEDNSGVVNKYINIIEEALSCQK